MRGPGTSPRPHGTLLRRGARRTVHVVGAGSYSLRVEFDGEVPPDGEEYDELTLTSTAGVHTLGRCRLERFPSHPRRRLNEAGPPPGQGTLLFLDQVHDFSALLVKGQVRDAGREFQQLPLLLGRRREIRDGFRDYTARLVFDLQVYRSLFDQIDRGLAGEGPSVRDRVHALVIAKEYGPFRALHLRANEELEALVAGFTQEEHEQHGYYFRKHLHDLIRASEFLTRTNTKPRGYAGDSEMMDLIYANEFKGHSLFSKVMHRFPLELPAAQAVRNRRVMMGRAVREALQAARARGQTGPLRVFSMACGSARELGDVLELPDDVRSYHFTLLDQDPDALVQAASTLEAVRQRTGVEVRADVVRESVRTMLRAQDLAAALGRHHFQYAMGLFDYLTPPVARAVLGQCYDLLLPGGEIVLGNFHTRNPTRVYMEYWADWVLYYRDEREMLDLASGLPGAQATVSFEDTACQMFLRVKKA